MEATPYTRRLGGEEATYWTMSVYLPTWLAEGKDTDGSYALAEVVIPKGVGEPPPHTHTREDEAYYIHSLYPPTTPEQGQAARYGDRT